MPDLGLQTQAERHFGFLASENGYRCVESSPYRVRFQSPSVFIELVFDGNRSYELDLLVGQTVPKESGITSFSISEILRLRRAPEAAQFSLVQVTSSEALASFVAQLAHLLQTYGGDIICGNDKSFVELAEHRQKEVKAYALERDLRMVRAKAEAAWSKKDYRAVVLALKPFRAALTATEVGKLEFAERQSSAL
jgi:hypothetical protein